MYLVYRQGVQNIREFHCDATGGIAAKVINTLDEAEARALILARDKGGTWTVGDLTDVCTTKVLIVGEDQQTTINELQNKVKELEDQLADTRYEGLME